MCKGRCFYSWLWVEQTMFKMLFVQSTLCTLCSVQYSELTALMHFENTICAWTDCVWDIFCNARCNIQAWCSLRRCEVMCFYSWLLVFKMSVALCAMFVFKITVCNILSILTTLMHYILCGRCVAEMQASADQQTWEVLTAMFNFRDVQSNFQYLVCAGYKQYSRWTEHYALCNMHYLECSVQYDPSAVVLTWAAEQIAYLHKWSFFISCIILHHTKLTLTFERVHCAAKCVACLHSFTHGMWATFECVPGSHFNAEEALPLDTLMHTNSSVLKVPNAKNIANILQKKIECVIGSMLKQSPMHSMLCTQTVHYRVPSQQQARLTLGSWEAI